MVFIGRARELGILGAELELVRRQSAGRFVWMHGRRRVGKSRLAQEFCDRSGARYAFYQAPRRSRPEALAELVDAVRESSLAAAASFEGAAYKSWVGGLRAAVQGATANDPAILVLDELPYLVELDAGFTADLQKAWDRTLEQAAVLLICIGSDTRMMQALVEEHSPLHGRPSREMQIEPLSPKAVGELTGASTASEAIERHLVVGGFPLLAASWPKRESLQQYLERALADDQTPLATTALRILSSELNHDLRAAKVIDAIGHGEVAYSRIEARSGVKGNTLTAALDTLVGHKRMVVKKLPYAAPPAKTGAKYFVRDPYLRFWLRFIGPYLSELSRGRPDLVLERILRDWRTYCGVAVEPIVRDAVERRLADPSLSKRLGNARYVGGWWRRDHSVEVDLVGGDAPHPRGIGFIGSIKWHHHDPFTASDARRLASHRAHVPGATAAKLVVVSRTGVEPQIDLDVDWVIAPDDLLAAW